MRNEKLDIFRGFMFFAFALGGLTVLYLFSEIIINVIKFLCRNKIFDWIFQQYVKHGLTIFLFHPFVFWLFLAGLKNNLFIGINPKISFTLISLLAIPSVAITAKCFSWVERIKVFSINKTQ